MLVGAQPKVFFKDSYRKPYHTNTNLDIERSSPRSYQFEVSKQHYCLNIGDIEGSSSRAIKFTTTRQTDPLSPGYKL